MESHHVKAVNTDKRSKNRLRFASNRQRSKSASADVYRSFKREGGVTSAAGREEVVHNPHREVSAKKRQRKHHTPVGDFKRNKTAILPSSDTQNSGDQDESEIEVSSSTFASELDVALDRNGSEIFSKFHRQVWVLVRSLPEILHYADKIIDLLMSFLLSPASSPGAPCELSDIASEAQAAPVRKEFVVNHGTTDILHLLAVLARDLRHEIHPYLHEKILPRIVQDLLNPPPPESGKQPIPMDATIVEAAFRTMSYLFRYDSQRLVEDMETIRKYYGATLAHRRELVRRLAAETFAPVIRMIKNESSRHRHLRRVLRALAASDNLPATSSLKKTQENAVDGISKLLFQVVRGIPGRMHTTGHLTVKFLLEFMTASKESSSRKDAGSGGQTIVYSVMSSFLENLCRHVDNANFHAVRGEILDALKHVVTSFVSTNQTESEFLPVLEMFNLVAQAPSARSGGEENDARVLDIIGLLCDKASFSKVPKLQQEETLSHFCQVWKATIRSAKFRSHLETCISGLLALPSPPGCSEVETISGRILVLSEKLLPHLGRDIAIKVVGTGILTAAVYMAKYDPEASLRAVFSVSNKRLKPSDSKGEIECDGDSNGDELFFPKNGSECAISIEEKESLLTACLVDFDPDNMTRAIVDKLGVALRCAPFLALACGVHDKQQLSSYKQVLKWIMKVLDKVSGIKGESAVDSEDLVVVKALALESLSRLTLASSSFSQELSGLKNNLVRAVPFAEKLLFSASSSIWAVKSVASFVEALQLFDLPFNDKANDVFDALLPNLRGPSHFLRLHTLQILAIYPPKPFVVDHADLDLEGDLDEEPTSYPNETRGAGVAGFSGPCDIMQTLLLLESAPVKLTSERFLNSLVSKIEVFGRTGRLPVIYAEAAANHMLGIFYVKLSPLWEGAARALGALATGHEDAVWPPLEAQLAAVMERPPDRGFTQAMSCDEAQSQSDHHQMCLNWETSKGTDWSIFQCDPTLELEVEGELSRHCVTDGETVRESVWRVLECKPQLLATHSRVLVPVFLRFLRSQYFFFHSNDPDSRELRLEDHVDITSSYTRNVFDPFILQGRLSSFLSAFSALEGPQQMVKHELLKIIFTSFLSHHDTKIAGLALSSFLKYKPPSVIPYANSIQEILTKNSLREALLRFGASIQAGEVDASHREKLIPVVCRIIFGRLSARVKGGKSSKDSPAARRAAILSFLSAMCQNEEELFPFLYLMTRSFIPTTMPIRPVEDYSSDDRLEVAKALMSIRDEHLLALPSAIYGGFLNLLGAVITQLGFRVSFFVPQCMSIIVAICNFAQVKRGADEKEDGESPIDDDEFEEQTASRTRYGPIRTLCCNRLSDLFGQFAESVDFEPFVDLFWTPLQNSIEFLPEMAVASENVPALLVLLRTISSHSQLFYFLSRNEAAVTAVIKCISATTTKAVITTVLAFVENLLKGGAVSGDDDVPIGKEIIYKHIPLLMEKLALRLRCGPTQRGPPVNPTARNQMKSQVTWRQELDILYKTSELITDGGAMQWDDRTDVLESMCTLLVPFLEVKRMTSESDKLNVLGILKVLVPRISSSAALAAFSSLSKILAPSKARQGISSLLVRQSVAAVIEAISERVLLIKQVAQKLVKLSAVHSKRIDEMDYDAIIPELNDLGRSGNEAGWLSLCGTNSPTLLAPIISVCFHFLYGDDGIVSRGAFHAIKALVATAAAKTPARNDPAQEDSESWTKTIESSVIPMARAGLHSRNPAIRRHFILIIAEISQAFQGQSSPQFHGDLCSLMCADNPDLDFFVNATHVQLHRRAKAFQRLRKHLNDNAHNTDECVLTQQSLSHVLLPLAMHPAYESKTKADELFALEAIATVGAICRFLSWSKYSSTLWTTLTQLDRHPDQERYLIGMICTIIDGFHFDVTELNSKDSNDVGEEDDGSDDELLQGGAVWRALHRRIIPRTEGLLLKEKADKNGTRKKNLRPTIALAMLKLFQKLPTKFFEARLPRLLGVICDALKNKDSGAREIARKTMAKMVVSMDLKYLADVIRELAITLTEGYYLHVRSAVVHSILQELAEVYKPSLPSSNLDTSTPSFDKCTAAFMDLIQEDLFGEARERRESKDTQVRFVKEASGTKSVHSIEILCRLITFRPSHSSNGREGRSSIHFVLLPLLERLRVATVDMSTIKKIKEILGRVVIGLAHNPSVTPEESLPFVYATIRPFVGVDPLAMIRQGDADDGYSDVDDDDADRSSLSPIKISGGAASKNNDRFQGSSRGVVVEWRPSTLKAATTSKAAREGNKEEKRELARVQDGASAPKLTGSYRYAPVKVSSAFGLDDPASISAVVFGLNLLSAFMKHTDLGEGHQFVAMMDPFLPLLTACVCHCRDTDVALMSLKCLVALLRFHLPSLPICAKSLGVQTLKLLTTLGASTHQNNDLTQSCFKTLTYLISLDASQSGQDEAATSSLSRTGPGGEEALAKGSKMPLDSGQMQILINLLKVSIAESEQHNPAYGLIKAIVSRRYVSAEFYDLMETMLKMSVRSQKSSVRQQSTGIFIRYLLNFPMGEERFDEHMKQIVLNFKYEYEEGRMSAMNLASMAMDKLPLPLLEKYAQLFFLPLVLQTANDESKECREAAASCLSHLLRRSSVEVLQTFFDYSQRWSKNPGPVQATSLRLFGIFVESCDEFMKRGDTAKRLLGSLSHLLSEKDADWEIPYLSLLCLEKLSVSSSKVLLAQETDLWVSIIDHLAHAHPWVKIVSCRVVTNYLLALDIQSFEGKNVSQSILVKKPGLLFLVAKNLCVQLNVKEEEQNDKLADLAIKSLAWILPVMKQQPHLCFEKEKEEDEENDEENREREPVQWLMTRLSSMAKNKGTKRRGAIFKCFAAFATSHNSIVSPKYLELMLEPLHRAIVEASNETENPNVLFKPTANAAAVSEDISLARDVLQMLEESCTASEDFLRAYAKVKTRARDKKEQRKVNAKTEAVLDPQEAAKRKVQKQLREKSRKKRRVDERRQGRGDKAKRRHGVT